MHRNVLYMLFNVVIIPESHLKTKRVGKTQLKVTTERSFLLCFVLVSLKKDKERIILVHFRAVEESFVHETRWRPPVIRDNTLRLSCAHSTTGGGHNDIHRTKC